MPPRRRQTIIAFIIFVIFTLLCRRTWQSASDIPEILRVATEKAGSKTEDDQNTTLDPKHRTTYTNQLQNSFHPGNLKPLGSNYTQTLIIARTKDEDVSWIGDNLGSRLADGSLKTAIYVADDTTAPLHPPKNKGHEVMVYLTYIIDYYSDLSDVNIFMHSHRIAWHNNELLDKDAVEILSRLSAERVQREGYINLRCHWIPGCPDWMHPNPKHESYGKKEEISLAKSWSELFPLDPLPATLAQPCCSQFALSADRLRSIPRERFVFYRDWLLRTSLSDEISGRVWEWLWQFVFTGHSENCPAEHICYCDSYGICFGDEETYKDWWKLYEQKRIAGEELKAWRSQTGALQHALKGSKLDEMGKLEIPEVGRDVQLEEDIAVFDAELNKRKAAAIERGLDPKNRANDVGRQWHDGDGF